MDVGSADPVEISGYKGAPKKMLKYTIKCADNCHMALFFLMNRPVPDFQ
jgi:hypothetical protein